VRKPLYQNILGNIELGWPKARDNRFARYGIVYSVPASSVASDANGLRRLTHASLSQGHTSWDRSASASRSRGFAEGRVRDGLNAAGYETYSVRLTGFYGQIEFVRFGSYLGIWDATRPDQDNL
jgi:hypothetical protein